MLHNSSRSRATNVVLTDNIPIMSEHSPSLFALPGHHVCMTADLVFRLDISQNLIDLYPRLTFEIGSWESRTLTRSPNSAPQAQSLKSNEQQA